MTESGVTIQRTDEYAVVPIEVAMTGELDRTVVPRAGALLDSALALHPTHLVLDLTRCSFLDAGGIALLLGSTTAPGRWAGASPWLAQHDCSESSR